MRVFQVVATACNQSGSCPAAAPITGYVERFEVQGSDSDRAALLARMSTVPRLEPFLTAGAVLVEEH